jgi:hypothetical protein
MLRPTTPARHSQTLTRRLTGIRQASDDKRRVAASLRVAVSVFSQQIVAQPAYRLSILFVFRLV